MLVDPFHYQICMYLLYLLICSSYFHQGHLVMDLPICENSFAKTSWTLVIVFECWCFAFECFSCSKSDWSVMLSLLLRYIFCLELVIDFECRECLRKGLVDHLWFLFILVDFIGNHWLLRQCL